jgi:hypothetical protein
MLSLKNAFFYYDDDNYTHIPLYRYMTPAEWSTLSFNSNAGTQWHLWNTKEHYGLHYEETYQNSDGIRIIYHPNAATGQFRNMYNNIIGQGPVYGVQKTNGYFRYDIQAAEQNAILAPDKCGVLVSNTGSSHSNQISDAISFTVYANSKFTFPAAQPQLPLYNDSLFCQQPWSLPGTTVTGGGGGATPNDDDFLAVHEAWITWTLNNPNPGTGGGIFDILSSTFDDLRSRKVFENSTGVPWWPGDIFDYIQLYRVDRTTGASGFELPYTIYRDSLFNENGSLKSFQINTPAGLYNLSLTISNQTINIPLLVDFSENLVHQSTTSRCDRLDVTIFPVPIVNKKFTTQLELDERATFKYSVLDEMGSVHFSQGVTLGENQVHEIPVEAPHLPNGLIFHTFEIEGECVRTITTIKNE